MGGRCTIWPKGHWQVNQCFASHSDLFSFGWSVSWLTCLFSISCLFERPLVYSVYWGLILFSFLMKFIFTNLKKKKLKPSCLFISVLGHEFLTTFYGIAIAKDSRLCISKIKELIQLKPMILTYFVWGEEEPLTDIHHI